MEAGAHPLAGVTGHAVKSGTVSGHKKKDWRRIIYRNNSGTWEKVTRGSGEPYSTAIVLSKTIGDYSTPSSAVLSSGGRVATSVENYDSNTGWTQVGTGVTVDSGDNNKMLASSVALHTHNRVHKEHPDGTISDTEWEYEFTFKLTAMATSRSAAIIAFTSTNDTMHSADALIVRYNHNGSTHGVVLESRDGGVAALSSHLTLSTGTQYYAKWKRTSATTVTLDVYSDSLLTALVGSLSLTIPSTVQGLQYIQHGSYAGGNSPETATYELDELNKNGRLQTNSESNPYIYYDLTSARDIVAIMLILETTETTVSEIKIWASTDTTFTDEEIIRTIPKTDFTNNTPRYILINRLPEDRRYVKIGGVGTGVLAVIEFRARYGLTDSVMQRHSYQRKLNPDGVESGVDSN